MIASPVSGWDVTSDSSGDRKPSQIGWPSSAVEERSNREHVFCSGDVIGLSEPKPVENFSTGERFRFACGA
jgi:hypothetical protein